MGSIIEAIGQNFERFVRWIYPGILFLLLLHLGRTDLLTQFKLGEEGIFGFIVLIVVFSFVFYNFHRLFFHEIILLRIVFYYLIHHSPLRKLADAEKGLSYWQYEKIFLKERFDEKNVDKNFSNYMLYRWGVTHATGTTAWILFLMWILTSETSYLSNLGHWILITGAIFFAAVYFYQSYDLTGIEEVFIQRYLNEKKRGSDLERRESHGNLS